VLRKREEGRGKREEGRGKREEGRGKREEGRGKSEECLNRLCALSSGARYVLDESSLTCSSDSLTHPLTTHSIQICS